MNDLEKHQITDEIFELIKAFLEQMPRTCGSREFYIRFMNMRAFFLKAQYLMDKLEDTGDYPPICMYLMIESCEKLLITLQPIAALCDSLDKTKH